jgi:transcriptional regulator with XRE-family HTH domain
MMRSEVAAFLRARREVLRPDDVGLTVGSRRRVAGLRREEVAQLANMSANYYERLERGTAPNPSPALLAGLSTALRLNADERDYLYRLAGQTPPAPSDPRLDADPGLMHIMNALAPTTPAFISNDLSFVVAQNPLNVALLGEFAGLPGRASNFLWRWFTDLSWRDSIYDEADQADLGRSYAAGLHLAEARRADSAASRLAAELCSVSDEFAAIWSQRHVDVLHTARKTLFNRHVGRLELDCDVVTSAATGQRIILFRPGEGTDAAERIQRLHDHAAGAIQNS